MSSERYNQVWHFIAAILLSANQFILIVGSLRHADRDYQTADKVMRRYLSKHVSWPLPLW